MVHESTHPLVKHKLTLLRKVTTEPKKFRELIRELAMLLCYEATADLGLRGIEVETPMGTAQSTWRTCRFGATSSARWRGRRLLAARALCQSRARRRLSRSGQLAWRRGVDASKLREREA